MCLFKGFSRTCNLLHITRCTKFVPLRSLGGCNVPRHVARSKYDRVGDPRLRWVRRQRIWYVRYVDCWDSCWDFLTSSTSDKRQISWYRSEANFSSLPPSSTRLQNRVYRHRFRRRAFIPMNFRLRSPETYKNLTRYAVLLHRVATGGIHSHFYSTLSQATGGTTVRGVWQAAKEEFIDEVSAKQLKWSK